MVSEELCFRAIVLLTSASNDLVLRRTLSNTTRSHLQNILPMLNDRLSQADAHQHDLVLYVVGILASTAVLFGNYSSARLHAAGISEIMRLRRGQGAIGGKFNHMLEASIDR